MSASMLAVTVFLMSALISWLGIGWLIKRLIIKGMVDQPNERTLHQGTIPRGGGLIIVVGLLLALSFSALFSGRPSLFICLGILLAAWATLSWWDDRYDLSPKFRFLVQCGISIITIAALGWVSHIGEIALLWFGPLVSVIGVLWMANLFNFMDGLDGFAASQSIVASISLAFWFYMHNDHYLALICVVIAACCYGFLLWNWHPAKVFMGDIGSISLGAFFATLFIIGVSRYNISIISFISLFGVFIADATTTILLRSWRREKIWLPHRMHFYQRLATAGYSHDKIAIGGLVLMLICSFLATLGAIDHDMISYSFSAVILVLIAAAILVIYLENRAQKSIFKQH